MKALKNILGMAFLFAGFVFFLNMAADATLLEMSLNTCPY